MNQEALEYITGTIERITYHNSENGFAVLKVQVKRHSDLVTITGGVPSAGVGEEINAQG
jgi:exodeoxyribonuclease V alpha subunit